MGNAFVINANHSLTSGQFKKTNFTTSSLSSNEIKQITQQYDEVYDYELDTIQNVATTNLFDSVSIYDYGAEVETDSKKVSDLFLLTVASNPFILKIYGQEYFKNYIRVNNNVKVEMPDFWASIEKFAEDYTTRNLKECISNGSVTFLLEKIYFQQTGRLPVQEFGKIPNLEFGKYEVKIPYAYMIIKTISHIQKGDLFTSEGLTDVLVKNGALRTVKELGESSSEKFIVNHMKKALDVPGNLKAEKFADLMKEYGNLAALNSPATKSIAKKMMQTSASSMAFTAGINILFEFGGKFFMGWAEEGSIEGGVDAVAEGYGDAIYKGSITTVFTMAGSFVEMTPLGKPGKIAVQAAGAFVAETTLSLYTIYDENGNEDKEKTQVFRAAAGASILAGGAVGLIVGIALTACLCTPPFGWAFLIVAGAILLGAAVFGFIAWVIGKYGALLWEGIVAAFTACGEIISAAWNATVDFIQDVGALLVNTGVKLIEAGKAVVAEFVEFGAEVYSDFKDFGVEVTAANVELKTNIFVANKELSNNVLEANSEFFVDVSNAGAEFLGNPSFSTGIEFASTVATSTIDYGVDIAIAGGEYVVDVVEAGVEYTKDFGLAALDFACDAGGAFIEFITSW